MQELSTQQIAEQVVAALRGKKCWYVSCGGSAGTTFKLAVGERVARDVILPSRLDPNPDEHSRFEGEAVARGENGGQFRGERGQFSGCVMRRGMELRAIGAGSE